MSGCPSSYDRWPLGRALGLLFAISMLATACSGSGDNAVPTTTTGQPRQIAEPETTTSTTTTTTTEAPPPPIAEVHVLGSLRTVPAAVAADAPAAAPVLDEDDATIASLACTRSSGCEPADLATWAANTLDAVNLATDAAAADGQAVLDEYAAALLASGVATAGYGVDLASATEPAIVGDPDLPLAVFALSLAESLPTDLIATETTPGIAAGADALAELIAGVEAVRAEGMRTLVLIDFGLLDSRAPSEEVTTQVEALVDAGADAIAVHGSEFLQRFERLDDTAVAFSLGNAATDTTEPLRADTALLRMVFDADSQSACLFPATGGASGVSMDDPSVAVCP